MRSMRIRSSFPDQTRAVTKVITTDARAPTRRLILHARIGATPRRFISIMSSQTVPATHFSELKSKIEQRQARVAIIGMGYVGLPLALLYSERGFPVTGFDIDQRKVSMLNAGDSYIFRITAPEIQRARKQGLSVTSDYSQLVRM